MSFDGADVAVAELLPVLEGLQLYDVDSPEWEARQRDRGSIAEREIADSLDALEMLTTPCREDEGVIMVRVEAVQSERVIVAQCERGDLDLNRNYLFSAAKDLTRDGPLEGWALGVDDLLLKGTPRAVLEVFDVWHAADLRLICDFHGVGYPVRCAAGDLRERLSEHSCTLDCDRGVLLMRTLRCPRGDQQIASGRARFAPRDPFVEGSYLDVASDELRSAIIREWQDNMATSRLRHGVCAVCGRKFGANALHLTAVEDIDLTLLRNDELPSQVWPTTYAFDAYDRALLHPKGLTDQWAVGELQMCIGCSSDLCDKGRMPKFALVNWLYYGRDELPPAAKRAFRESTLFDRLLVCRARASRISFRFSEVRQGDGVERRPGASQRFVKGNVVVMPQDATHLNDVLPPDDDVMRDTVCAVFVGQSKPSRENIGALSPALVRKSRVRTMIDFLVARNPHYAVGPGFRGLSRRNLDMLFGADAVDVDEGVPCSLEIGFLEDNDALRGATADYAGRSDVVEAPEEGGELLMENVGYTQCDTSPQSYQQMKATALTHCLDGGKFVQSQAGNRFIPDFENPQLLSWLFPALDPWGIGGFFESRRAVPLTLDEQLKYLLMLDDDVFAKDPDFAFVYYNIRQKRSVCDTVNFRVRASQASDIVRRLLRTDTEVLETLMRRYKENPLYQPETPSERDAVALLKKVSMVGRDLPGTAAYKVVLRNEIRALVHFKGTPALFVTLNPSDVTHPLVRLYSGENIVIEDMVRGEELTEWRRKVIAARNPAACAMFFETTISGFLRIILRYGRPGRGLFGTCSAFFGTVEAQGRGTLHCHMLIWIEGHPSPQRLRDLMVDSREYEADVFRWLESIIKCELLGTVDVVTEPDGNPLPRPRFGNAHPGVLPPPDIRTVPVGDFEREFRLYVNQQVRAFNWHEHTDTCWKYLRRGERKDDEHCRMRIDGTTRPVTGIDAESGGIVLRRLHPRIANYNDVVMFLVRANMDIKHIGSGQGAKALIYYVTDYITKAPLSSHVGLSALLYAIQRAGARFGTELQDVLDVNTRSALTITVNSMLSRMEISHQQVMSYLVGGGDHYTSHRYRSLHFGSFDRLFRRVLEEGRASDALGDLEGGVERGAAEPQADTRVSRGGELQGDDHAGREWMNPRAPSDDGEGVADAEHADNVLLHLGEGSISAVSQQNDYMFRSTDEPFDCMCLYEFVGMVERITRRREEQRVERRRVSTSAAGRKSEVRGLFTEEHPLFETHMLRRRTVWVVPVVLGDAVPRPDRSEEERTAWSRMMLMLFVPWRHPMDLRAEHETWNAAYDRRSHEIGEEHAAIVKNMSVLSECRDARDELGRAALAVGADELGASGALDGEESPADLAVARQRGEEAEGFYEDFDGFDAGAGTVSRGTGNALEDKLDEELGVRVRIALDACQSAQVEDAVSPQESGTRPASDVPQLTLSEERDVMRRLKKRRHPAAVEDQGRSTPPRVNAQLRAVEAEVGISSLDDVQAESVGVRRLRGIADNEAKMGVIRQVINERGLDGNAEQLRAFDIVARHACFSNGQLLMYIGGVGGTGKTYVVQAILRLFQLLGRSDEILVAAPTGAAALLIGGYTMHSLAMLPERKKGANTEALMELWKNIRWAITDEVSMVGGKLMSQWSNRIQQAKGDEGVLADAPYGGVNMIFLGDFGQLRPVKQAALYSYKLVKSPGLESCRDQQGVSALMGAYLWRMVTTVVLLKQNQRQRGDPAYVDLLARVRVGECTVVREGLRPSDAETLRSRELCKLAETAPDQLRQFKDAPIIVGRKKVRDVLNARMIAHRAAESNQVVHLYHSRDAVSKQAVDGPLRDALWALPSAAAEDSFGRLPMFSGMKVMVQENLAFSHGVVNGAEGIVEDIVYEEDDDGRRYATVVHVRIAGAGAVCDSLPENVVPIFPETTSFRHAMLEHGRPCTRNISRTQLPLLPAYAYTDYKSQGRSLSHAIVDLASAQSLQGVYVMLSRVRSLNGLAVLRPFSLSKLVGRTSEELRDELSRLARLDDLTARWHGLLASGEEPGMR